MSLEQLYNDAQPNTYVGTVRTRQSEQAGPGQSMVNFFDGEPRSRSETTTQDTFQKEFTRNQAGQHKSGGGQGISRNPNQSYTRWTDKAFKLAFDGHGPATLSSGFYTTAFRTDRSTNKLVHLYTPRIGTRLQDVSFEARKRVTSSPSGAPTF